MSVYSGPNTSQSGLVLHIDPSNPRCYPGSGTTLFDLSGGGNNGVLTNGANILNSNSGVMNFDGVNDYIEFGTNLPLGGISRFSLSCWLFTSSSTDNIFPLMRYNTSLGANRQNEYFGFQPTGGIIYPATYFGTLGSNTNYQYFDSTSLSIPLNTWTFACFSIDLSAGFGEITVNNNTVSATRTAAGTPTTIFATNNSVPYTINRYIGFTGTTFYGNGRLSDIRVYSTYLNRSEVLKNYHATKGRYGL